MRNFCNNVTNFFMLDQGELFNDIIFLLVDLVKNREHGNAKHEYQGNGNSCDV